MLVAGNVRRMISNLGAWPHRWYGYWNYGAPASKFPALNDAIDVSWSPPDKKQLVTYLDGAPLVRVYSYTGFLCPLCAAMLDISERTDGVWVWPMSLSHFVKLHGVVIPDAFAGRIREQDYVPPSDFTGSIGDLPWPHRDRE